MEREMMENDRVVEDRTGREEGNVGESLSRTAARIPEGIAVVEPRTRRGKPVLGPDGRRLYRTITFGELNRRSDRVAAALRGYGVKKGSRIVLMVRHGADFITLVYALFKVGAILVLIDPGMGIRQMLGCLREARPDGFAALSPVQAMRVFCRRSFPDARLNLTVGRRWFWGGLSLASILKDKKNGEDGESFKAEPTRLDDPAAIIFTSGSTGPAKGVLYTHRIIQAQVEEIQSRYAIEPGTVDMAAFPFFGLFNAAMGTTTVIPDMDTSRPASVDPEKFLEVAHDWKISECFASPAVWNRVVRYCVETGGTIPTLKRAISAGAPFPVALLEDFLRILPDDADVFTPYGATESLPVASIGGREILSETAEASRRGKGTCVGKRFSRISWRVIPITDEPIETLESVESLPPGEIGELIVTGPQVTREYVTRVEANRFSKIKDGSGRIWHRIGDVGWIDEEDRFWFCGRKAHRVESPTGPFFSIPCEAIVNNHPSVFRSALAGIPIAGDPDHREPVLIIEPKPGLFPTSESEREKLLSEIRELASTSPITASIRKFLLHPRFPTDVRHNAKINRELLSLWAAGELSEK